VQVSEQFKQELYGRFDHRCPLSGIERPELLTVSHIVARAEEPGIAEDPRNSVGLNWTHQMAFDAGL
jgi:putative restriction endonuclease